MRLERLPKLRPWRSSRKHEPQVHEYLFLATLRSMKSSTGAVLRGLAEQDVGRDLRAGVVSWALDVLPEKGAVREHGTHEEARVALVW